METMSRAMVGGLLQALAESNQVQRVEPETSTATFPAEDGAPPLGMGGNRKQRRAQAALARKQASRLERERRLAAAVRE